VSEFAFALRFLAALAVVAGVLFGLRYAGLAVQRGRARSDSRYLAVLDTAYLPGGASLHVVRAGERLIVVGRCASSIAMLGELGAAPARGPVDALRET
jgi:flagellar biogenesis protein FliO